jgi:hypothetical protein
LEVIGHERPWKIWKPAPLINAEYEIKLAQWKKADEHTKRKEKNMQLICPLVHQASAKTTLVGIVMVNWIVVANLKKRINYHHSHIVPLTIFHPIYPNTFV